MTYEEIKPKFKIGDAAYFIKKNCFVKANVIGVKIHPFPNPDLNPFKYMFTIPELDVDEAWVDEDILYDNVEDLIAESTKYMVDGVMNYDELAENNWAIAINMVTPGE